MVMHTGASTYTQNSNLNWFLGIQQMIQYVHIYYHRVSRRAAESKFYNTEK